MITLTKDQANAFDAIIEFVNKAEGENYFTLGGYAGTGKTTLISELARQIKESGRKIAFCAFSGKASLVLRSKLKEILTDQDYCGTIHSLIYILVGKNKEKRKLYFDTNDKDLDYDIIIVDEASMIDEYIFKDLLSFGIPILFVGDHGQLPPVKGKFNLMQEPMIRLETIMRQAEDNPIIKLATMARNGEKIPCQDFGNGVKKVNDRLAIDNHDFSDFNSIVLCATNQTRKGLNSIARKRLGRQSSDPMVGEPIICLFNNRRKYIFNGNIGVIKSIQTHIHRYAVEVDMGDFIYEGYIDRDQFFSRFTIDKDEVEDNVDLFDWAYGITTHKSQGSEFKHVTLYQEYIGWLSPDDQRRWMYTAITRAKETLTIIER